MKACVRTRGAIVAVVVLSTAALLAGCAATPPEEDPSIRGTITALEQAGVGASLLVESGPDPEYAYDRASVRVDADTRCFFMTSDGDIEAATIGDLALGQQVDVWFTGAVAESYPVQATAGSIVILR